MDHHQQEQTALHRRAVIAEAAGDKLTARERGALVRQIAARAHAHPDGSSRTYSRGTIDRWLRAWRKGGLQALMPAQRADSGVVRAHPELFARPQRCGRSCPAAQPRSRTSGGSPTCWPARGCAGHAGTARCGPGCSSSSMTIPGCWSMAVLQPGKRPGLPGAAAPGDHPPRPAPGFLCGQRGAFCQRLAGPHLRRAGHPAVHSKPYSPEGRGKQERLNRYIREAFLAEAVHRGIESLEELNDLFTAWAGQVAKRRVHAETGQAPIERFAASGSSCATTPKT